MASNISTSAIRDIYQQLLRVESNTITSTEKVVSDALGNDSALKISTLAVRSTNKFYINNPGVSDGSESGFLVHNPSSKEVKIRTVSSIAEVPAQYLIKPDNQALATSSAKIDITSTNNLPINATGVISVNSSNELVLAAGHYRISASIRVTDATTPTPNIFAQINRVGSASGADTVDKLVSSYKLIVFSEVLFISNAQVAANTNKVELKMHAASDTATISGGYVLVEKIASVDAEIGTINLPLGP